MGFLLDDPTLVDRYLQRINWPADATTLRASALSHPCGTLLALLECHCRSVPFENLDQHPHEAAGPRHRFVPAHNVWESGTRVGVARSVEKLVDYRRGGFCFEGNLAFCWLVRHFYADVKLSLAQSYNPAIPDLWNLPSHVVLLVDLKQDGGRVLVDPFWGVTFYRLDPILLYTPHPFPDEQMPLLDHDR